MKVILLCLAILAGSVTAVQPPINGALRSVLGHPLWATVANFVVGLIALLILTVISRAPLPSFANLAPHPWWYWLGGLCGAFFVLSSVLLIRDLGAAVFFSCVVAGQLLTAVALDHFGVLGVPEHPLSLLRLCGVILLCAGTVLIRVF